jgi:predicted amidohydrolase YtcJ
MKRTFIAVMALTIVGPGVLLAQSSLPPDVIYHTGKIFMGNEDSDIVEALAVRDGRIIAVGSSADLERLASDETRLVDLQGKTVLPGFYENHNHVSAGNLDPRVQNWRDIASREDLLTALSERAAELPTGEWIIGTLRNENMPQHKLPTRWEIDEVVAGHPVFLRRGHISVANSLALQQAGITSDTPDPPGGKIEKNDDGEPIGWQRESSGHRQVTGVIPPPPPPDANQARDQIQDQLESLLSHGITSVNVPGVRPEELGWFQDVYSRAGERIPRAIVQLRVRPGYDQYDDAMEGADSANAEIEALSFHTGFGNERMKLGAIKMSIDGGFSAAGFWTIPGYPDRPDYHGVIRIPEEALYRVAKRAHDRGWQLGIHAIGDGAVQMSVNVLERIVTESPRPDHRHYIHHFSVMPPEETFRKMVKWGILVSSQPNFTYSLGPYNASPGLTPERLETNNPQRTVLRYGIPLSYGSDGMPTGPLVGIYAAVTRKGVDGKVYGPDERLTIEEAVRAYTMGSAYQNFDEDNWGSLEIGKFADMVILNEDILTVDPDRIKDLWVEQTIINGVLVYSASGPPPVSDAN